MSRGLSFSVCSVIDSVPFWCTVHWEWGPLWKYVVWDLRSRFAGVVSAYLETYNLTLRLPSCDVNCIWVIRSYRFEFQKSVGVFQIPAIIKWSQYYQCLPAAVGWPGSRGTWCCAEGCQDSAQGVLRLVFFPGALVPLNVKMETATISSLYKFWDLCNSAVGTLSDNDFYVIT